MNGRMVADRYELQRGAVPGTGDTVTLTRSPGPGPAQPAEPWERSWLLCMAGVLACYRTGHRSAAYWFYLVFTLGLVASTVRAIRLSREEGAGADRAPEEVPACADPVDVATGDVILGETGVSLPGALPLVLRRRHRSSWRTGRWHGRSWLSSFDDAVLFV